MKKRLSVVIVAIALGAAAGAPVEAADKWEQIGQEKLKDRRGETSFRIGVGEGRYRFIKFKAEGGDVKLDEVTINFTVGDDQKVERLGKIRDGKETRPINVGLALKSAIKNIRVKYETNTDDRVTLVALGKKD